MAFLYNYCSYNSGRFQASFWDDCCPDYSEVVDPSLDWACSDIEDNEWQEVNVVASAYEKIKYKTDRCEFDGWTPAQRARRARRGVAR